MHVQLTPELCRFVEEKVLTGEYASPDEVVKTALLRMKREGLGDEELARLIAVGREEADRGELIDAEEVFAEIRRRSAARRGNQP